MALETRLNAVHGINRYLYEKGKAAGIFPVETTYGGRSAFAPVEEIGTFSKMTFTDSRQRTRSVPYVVYNWATPAIGSDWFMKNDQIIYLIYSGELDEIRKISNFIVDTMNQWDRSATNVAAWLEKLKPGKWGGQDHNPYMSIELYAISVENANGPTPITEAGGRMEALITLNVQYGVVADSTSANDEA